MKKRHRAMEARRKAEELVANNQDDLDLGDDDIDMDDL